MISPRPSVLVTGAAGFIGAAVAREYRSIGTHVIAVDDFSSPTYQGRTGIFKRRVQDLEPHDVEGVKVIVHCASPVGSLGVLTAPDIALEMARMAGRVAHLANETRAALVHVSSSEVYGGESTVRRVVSERDECVIASTPSPRRDYQIGKLAAEAIIRAERWGPHISLRPFNVTGPDQSGAKGFVVPRFIAQARAGESLTVYHPGTQRRAIMALQDLVRAIVYYARDWALADVEVVNLGAPGNEVSMMELANQVRVRVRRVHDTDATLKLCDPVELHGSTYVEGPGKIPDITLARKLGWEPHIGLGELLDDCIANERR